MVATLLIKQLDIKENTQFVIIDSVGWVPSLKWLMADKNIPSIFFTEMGDGYSYIKKFKKIRLYIDADVGFRKYLTLLALKFFGHVESISVYEEGLGTYRDDLYSGLKKKFINAIGGGTNFGGCSLVKDIYVFVPNEYSERIKSKCEVKKINSSISLLVKENINTFSFDELVLKKFEENYTYKICFVYLPSWDADTRVLECLQNKNGLIIYKHHPHRRNKIPPHLYDVEIDGGAPAEFVITKLLNYFDKIYVYHHGTSVERYIQNERIEFIMTLPMIRFDFS